jgi:hypothetical protein
MLPSAASAQMASSDDSTIAVKCASGGAAPKRA